MDLVSISASSSNDIVCNSSAICVEFGTQLKNVVCATSSVSKSKSQ